MSSLFVASERRHRYKKSVSNMVYRRLSQLDQAGCVYPSLNLLRQTQDKLLYISGLTKIGIDTGDVLIPAMDLTQEKLYLTSTISPSHNELESFIQKHDSSALVLKGSPSVEEDSVYILHPSPSLLQEAINATILLSQKQMDVFAAAKMVYSDYDIFTYWKGTTFLDVIATKHKTVSVEDGRTGGTLSDVLSFKDISSLQDVGQRVLNELDINESDFVRLDFRYDASGSFALTDLNTIGLFHWAQHPSPRSRSHQTRRGIFADKIQ
eukprot:GILJ01015796.1.p1 GENE.GILJ01015796.1~~GILJ01015796.1.p1  ORF type:complete len:266 (+),score=31.02 GILJ01015796.1:577-1374(+)